MEISEVERAVHTVLGGESLVAAVYLFGSVARGTAHGKSDVDLGVLYTVPPRATLRSYPFDLEADLARRLGCPVQLVVLNTAPVDLVHRVLRDGRLLLEHDRSARIAFEVRSRNLYFDMLPTWTRYRKLA